MKLALVAAAAALALIVGIAATRGPATTAGGCGTVRGGVDGGYAQLRFVDSREDHATFTFGQSQNGTFQPPPYELSESARAGDHRVFRLRFSNASTVNPDGSPSLEGLPLLQPADDELRQVRLISDADRTITWEITSEGARCPRVTAKRYTQGTFPRVQVVVMFADKGAITVEPATMVGPQVWVSGIAFAADNEVDVILNDTTVTAMTTATGTFEKALYVFDLPPGLYRVRARDRVGHDASASLTIPLQPIVPDLVPR
ncbi:MAG: hypothetical protein AUH85_16065 [Chloroflexi bacterium 13_1_40CM_4_68_4]|nr:MAG: hypothetical protein AUH85_16065 [Chloroflexi bacterium 13_1_40CM_4_68_4]